MDSEYKSHEDIAQNAIQVWNEYEENFSVIKRSYRTIIVVSFSASLQAIVYYTMKKPHDNETLVLLSTILSISASIIVLFAFLLNIYRARKRLVSVTIIVLRAREHNLLSEIRKNIDALLNREVFDGR